MNDDVGRSAQTDATRRKPLQPLSVLNVGGALLRLQTVQDLTGLGKTSIYSKIRAGHLNPVRLSPRCTRFKAEDVQQFLQRLGKGAE